MAKRGKRAQICAVLMAAAVSMTSVPAMAAGQTDSAVSTAESATENTGSEAKTEQEI